jgi:predicted Rossmann fold flavoprotein
MNDFDLIVIGGGAAGFFGAIQAAGMHPGLSVLILEKTNKILSKVRVSGGGRCNVTHHCFNAASLAHHYPRGEKPLKELFKTYQAKDTVEWFEARGVDLKAEEDGRMFPVSDSSQTIIDCFLKEALRLKIKIEAGLGVEEILPVVQGFEVRCQTGKVFSCRKVFVASGGHPKPEAYNFITKLGHSIIPPVPSLFTFNDSQKEFSDLMGIAVPAAEVRIAGTKFLQQGPVLITHWGLSGPAIIKLSAWAAEFLHQQQYQFTAMVSWIGPVKEEELRSQLQAHRQTRGKQKVMTNPLMGLPQRLWQRLCECAAIDENRIWAELPQKNLNKLIEYLIRCPFLIKGKTTFKEEFVTCGGVDLKEVDLQTMESKKVNNLFFAGEVLNIDGETGGFNFQSAWTTAFVAAKSMSKWSK